MDFWVSLVGVTKRYEAATNKPAAIRKHYGLNYGNLIMICLNLALKHTCLNLRIAVCHQRNRTMIMIMYVGAYLAKTSG